MVNILLTTELNDIVIKAKCLYVVRSRSQTCKYCFTKIVIFQTQKQWQTRLGVCMQIGQKLFLNQLIYLQPMPSHKSLLLYKNYHCPQQKLILAIESYLDEFAISREIHLNYKTWNSFTITNSSKGSSRFAVVEIHGIIIRANSQYFSIGAEPRKHIVWL